ncbi:MAG: hypothetical protein U1D30_07870 [Planctomycetota bacterium]
MLGPAVIRSSKASFAARFRFLPVGLLACTLAGCYERVMDGDEAVYKFSLWIPIAVMLGSAIAFPVGWAVRSTSQRFGWGLMIASPVLLFVISPGLFLNRVTVDKDHFTCERGFWFSPAQDDIRFDELSDIRLVEKSGRRGRKSYELHCRKKDGQVTVVPLGDLIQNAWPEIAERAHERNITLIDGTN